MNKIFVRPTIVLLLFAQAATGQSVDAVINKNIKSKGGIEKIRSIRTIVFSGTATNKGKEIGVKFLYDHNKAMRTEFTLGKSEAYSILTRTEGWRSNAADSNKPMAMQEWEIQDGQFQLDAQGVYIDYKQKGYEGIYLGKDTALGKTCEKIKLVKKGEGDKIYYFDEDGMLLKTIIQRKISDGSYIDVLNYYLDYRKNQDGYLFSYLRKTATDTIVFTDITTNAYLPEIYFKVR